MKAIKITKENKTQLTDQYSLDEGFLDYASGLYLVAGFGDSTYEGLLTPASFTERYSVIRKLDNGFYEIIPKAVLAPEFSG